MTNQEANNIIDIYEEYKNLFPKTTITNIETNLNGDVLEVTVTAKQQTCYRSITSVCYEPDFDLPKRLFKR